MQGSRSCFWSRFLHLWNGLLQFISNAYSGNVRRNGLSMLLFCRPVLTKTFYEQVWVFFTWPSKVDTRKTGLWGSLLSRCMDGAIEEAWNFTMSVQCSQVTSGLQFFNQKQLEEAIPDKLTFLNALSSCSSEAALARGKWIHTHITQSGFESEVVATVLVKMYAKCGSLEDAQRTFSIMSERDVVAWTAMISAYAQTGHGKEALKLFFQMQLEGVIPNKITFICIFNACTRKTFLAEGKKMHVHALNSQFQSDVVFATALVNMYGKCASLEDARNIFDQIDSRDVFCWTAMIAAYAHLEQGKGGQQLFDQMQQEGVLPNRVTYVSLVSACASQMALAEAKKVHSCLMPSGVDSDIVIANAVISMYSKCSSLRDAQKMFGEMRERDIVSWNAMIDAFAEHEAGKDALQLFEQMQQEGTHPNQVTYISLLCACATLVAIFAGKRIHALIHTSPGENGCDSGVDIMNALLNMYGKCGSMEEAQKTFDDMLEHDIISWNAVIAVYAQYGFGKDAFQLLNQMQQDGVKPDKVTFLSILSACSHAGLVDEGCECMMFMNQVYGLSPTATHYDCFIDLFGRAGRLDEAEVVIHNMPCGPTSVSWLSFLGACRNHVDIERGEHAAKCVVALAPQTPSPYKMLANIYSGLDKWADATNILKLMRSKIPRNPQIPA